MEKGVEKGVAGGVLVAVVGPSGAGKDTLLAGARTALAADPRYRFVRRCISRPATAGGEEHEALSPEEFAARAAAGGFALTWQAHGLHYGIPADIAGDLAAGRVVVANLSRTVLAAAAARLPLRVLEVTAPAALLARRLAARGREDAADVAARLARAAASPAGLAAMRVVNDGAPEAGIAAMLDLLRSA
ncbi:MAG: phosphonate metabolism protein/1,5-bisphosphokinase (PRPP-forming) PhnN [Paracraurococcus sp.]